MGAKVVRAAEESLVVSEGLGCWYWWLEAVLVLRAVNPRLLER